MQREQPADRQDGHAFGREQHQQHHAGQRGEPLVPRGTSRGITPVACSPVPAIRAIAVVLRRMLPVAAAGAVPVVSHSIPGPDVSVEDIWMTGLPGATAWVAGRRAPGHQPPRCARQGVSCSGRSMPVVPRHDRGRGGPPWLRSFPASSSTVGQGQAAGTGPAGNNDPRSAYRASIRQAALPHLSIRSGKPKAEAQIHPNNPGTARAARSPGVTGAAPGVNCPKGS